MIKQISSTISYTTLEEEYLEGLKPYNKKTWDGDSYNLKSIKDSIRVQLLGLSDNNCMYCGLPLNETSRSEIDHIAPKSNPQFAKFCFTKENLAIACSFCNGSSLKHNHETVKQLRANYSRCEFLIVHPYYDNPEDHYDITITNAKIFYCYKTDKGRYSIYLFGLSSLRRTEARAKEYKEKLRNETRPIGRSFYILIDKILMYRNRD